jgi:broad specificity phosphatase PhoE
MKVMRIFSALALALVVALPASAQTTVILVRHAEKAGAPANDPPLTPAGQKRAQRLAEYLKYANVNAVYSTPLARARETAGPLVDGLKLKLEETQPTAQYAANTAARIKQNNKGQTVLVVGHSNTTPALIKELTGIDVPAISDPEYDNLYIVTIPVTGKPTVIRAKY